MTLAIPIGLCVANVATFGSWAATSPATFAATVAGAAVCLLWLGLLTWALLRIQKQNRLRDADHTRLSRAVHGLCRRAYKDRDLTAELNPVKTEVWTHDEQWRLRKETGPR